MKESIMQIIVPLLEPGQDPSDSLPLDSLKVLQLVMALDEGGFSIPLEQIASIRCLGDIIALAGKTRS